MRLLYFGGFLYLLLEVFLIVDFIEEFGTWAFFLETIGSAVLGLVILFGGRLGIMKDLSELVAGKITPMEFLGSNLFRTLGAFFLIFPGILSDILGIILECIGFFIANTSFFRKTSKHRENFHYTSTSSYSDDEVIDVEIVSDEKNPKREK